MLFCPAAEFWHNRLSQVTSSVSIIHLVDVEINRLIDGEPFVYLMKVRHLGFMLPPHIAPSARTHVRKQEAAMSGMASTAAAVQQIRHSHLQLTVPFAYEFTYQILGDEEGAAALVSDVLLAGNDANVLFALDYVQARVLNRLYRRALRITALKAASSDPANPLSILSLERRAAVVVHDVMRLDRSASASALGVSKERFAEILRDARVALRDHLSGLGLV